MAWSDNPRRITAQDIEKARREYVAVMGTSLAPVKRAVFERLVELAKVEHATRPL